MKRFSVLFAILLSPSSFAVSDHDSADKVEAMQSRERAAQAQDRQQAAEARGSMAEKREEAAYKLGVEIVRHNGIAVDGKEPYEKREPRGSDRVDRDSGSGGGGSPRGGGRETIDSKPSEME